MREGAALGVLAGDADVDALGQQRAERQRLGVAELDAAALDRLDPLLERLAQLAVDGEAVGDADQLLVQLLQRLLVDGRLDLGAAGAVELAGAGRGRVLELAGLDLLAQLLVGLLQRALPLLLAGLDVVGGDDPLLDQRLGVDLGDRRVLLDLGRHQRLGVGGLVGLVVAEAAVADQVDDDVAAPALAVGHRQPDRADAGLGVVGVDVDDRDVEALRHVGRVRGGAGLLGLGGEADLVVLDDVDGAAGGVAGQRLQVEGLGDDALAGEGGVAVQQHRHRDRGVVLDRRVVALGLRGPGGAGHDRVHELEVARVGVEADADLGAVAGGERCPCGRSGT